MDNGANVKFEIKPTIIRRVIMRVLAFVLGVLLFCGCSFIVADDKDISSFGIKKDEASSLTQEIKRQRPEEPREFKLFPGANLK